ncbi:MAG: histidine phosphatase family protein [Spirochaetales bacterium]|nr:histidine phosphatase family protein [Spirochaetales bacterium]
MKTELVLIRHGETYWNKENKFQGIGESHLTDLGIRQAQAAAKALTGEHFDAVYASPLIRAKKTAEIITGGLDSPSRIVFDGELVEWRLGIFEGLSITEIKERFPEEYVHFSARDPDYVIPEGESSRQRYERAIGCLQRIADKHPGERLLVITHRGILDSVIRRIMFVPLDRLIAYSQFNCGLNTIEIDGDTWRLLTWGDARHLAGADGEHGA